VNARELLGIWEGRQAALRKLAEGIPEGQEGCRAAPGTMSLAEQVLHVISSEKTLRDVLTVTPGKWEWQTGIDAEHYPKRGDLLEVMDRESAETRNYLGSLTDGDLKTTVKPPWGGENTLEVMWVEWFTHDAHHCGSIVSTMRAGGIEPPNIWG